MIRLNDQQAEEVADLFGHLNEVFSVMNTFIDDASSGKINSDHAAQLRGRTASIMESAAQVAEMFAERPKRTRSDRPSVNYGSSGRSRWCSILSRPCCYDRVFGTGRLDDRSDNSREQHKTVNELTL